MARDLVNQATQAGKTAQTTAGNYGSQAGAIGANLVPFATRMMNNPTGYSQRDQQAMTTNAMAGAGGATAGLYGLAGKRAGTTNNPMGFSSALDAAARQRDKAVAGTAEGIAAKNADVKLNQQDNASRLLSGLYGTDVRGQIASQGQTAEDVNAAANAQKFGWLQNMGQVMEMLKPNGSFGGGQKASFGFGG